MQISILLCPLLRVVCPLFEEVQFAKEVQSYGCALKYSSVCFRSTFITVEKQ
jgi:hypothetical protein